MWSRDRSRMAMDEMETFTSSGKVESRNPFFFFLISGDGVLIGFHILLTAHQYGK